MLEILQVHENFSWSTEETFWDVFSFLPIACAQESSFNLCFGGGASTLQRYVFRVVALNTYDAITWEYSLFPHIWKCPILHWGTDLCHLGRLSYSLTFTEKKVSELSDFLTSTFFLFFPLQAFSFSIWEFIY